MNGFGLYWPGESFLHGMDPRGKLVAFLLLCIGVFICPYLLSILLVLTMLVFLARGAGVPPRLLLGGGGFLVLIVAFAALTRLSGGMRAGLLAPLSLMVGRMAVLLVGTNLFTLTTSSFQLNEALRKTLGGPAGFTALLAFRFFPVLEEERVRITRAQILRGAPLDAPNVFKRFRAYPALLVPLFVLTFRRAEQLATAMTLRSFSPQLERTPLKTIRWKATDTFFLLVFAAFLCLVFVAPARLPVVLRYPVQ